MDDRPVCARSRHGRLSVRLGPPGAVINAAVNGAAVVTLEHADEGLLFYDELVALIAGVLAWPVAVAEYDDEQDAE